MNATDPRIDAIMRLTGCSLESAELALTNIERGEIASEEPEEMPKPPTQTAGLEIKQVIVMRDDLNMRKGKMAAQAAHAAMAFLVDKLGIRKPKSKQLTDMPQFSTEEAKWLTAQSTKVVVRVKSEAELMQVYQNAVAKRLNAHLILDAGRTEFGGVPTYTCCAIGPNYAHEVDSVTGNLELL